MTYGEQANTVGEILLERAPAYVSEETIAELTGLPGYGVRWYIFQLREAGFMIDAAMYTDRAAFAQGARGWRLVDVGSEPYRPADHAAELPPAVPAVAGLPIVHADYGKGTIVFAAEGRAKVVARFGAKRPRVEIERTEVLARFGQSLVLVA